MILTICLSTYAAGVCFGIFGYAPYKVAHDSNIDNYGEKFSTNSIMKSEEIRGHYGLCVGISLFWPFCLVALCLHILFTKINSLPNPVAMLFNNLEKLYAPRPPKEKQLIESKSTYRSFELKE